MTAQGRPRTIFKRAIERGDVLVAGGDSARARAQPRGNAPTRPVVCGGWSRRRFGMLWESGTLRYDARGTSSITHLERVSKPGRRVYVGSHDIPKVLGGYGVNIVSTSKGLMSGKTARRENIGGELLAQIY